MAPPTTAATVRMPISEPALQAKAVATAVAVAAAKPMRKIRRWPCRSPSFPSKGRVTAEHSMGAVITQAMVVSRTANSPAIGLRARVRIVIGKVVANMPARAANSTQVG